MIQIPVYQNLSSDFLQEIDLNGQLVQIRIIFNVRNHCFHMDFKDQSGSWVYGIKIVPNYPLLWHHRGSIIFEGDLMVVRVDEDVEDYITYNNFGIGWTLNFLTVEETTEWREDNGL